jgi:hypothetical protein
MSDDVAILTGPPIPTILPAKGIAIFVESGKLRCYLLSEMTGSDMAVRTPVGLKNGFRFLWNLWRQGR